MVAPCQSCIKSLIKPPKGDPHNDPGQYAAVLQHIEHPKKLTSKGGKVHSSRHDGHPLSRLWSFLRETYAKVSILPKRAAPGGWLESFHKVVKKRL